MTFTVRQADDNFIIEGSGEIVQGDRVRLVTAIDEVPLQGKVLGLSLDSPGGNIFEAEKLSATIRSSALAVGIGAHKLCASACFLLFAAATQKFTSQSSLIGVHSASENGSETLGSMGFTMALARDAAGYGVPDAILGHMVATQPGNIFWLKADDLVSMGARIFPDEVQGNPEVAATQPGSLRPASQGQDGALTSTAFQRGLADREATEQWVKSLGPDEQAGALYWAGQRSLKKPGSCVTSPEPAPTDLDAWSRGCLGAQKMFYASDRRRRTDPDYKAGWNSFTPS